MIHVTALYILVTRFGPGRIPGPNPIGPRPGRHRGTRRAARADGRKVADRGPMTFEDDARPLTADITGADIVRLVVADNGSADSDHADWADIKITCS